MKISQFRALALTTGSVLLASLVACTAPPSEAPTSKAPGSEAPTEAGASVPIPTCETQHLTLAKVSDDAGAGNQALNLAFMNESEIPCRLEGYPTVVLLNSRREQLRLGTVDTTQTPFLEAELAQPVTIRRAEQAFFQVAYEVVPVGNQQSCPTAAELEVTPPNQVDTLSLPINTPICGTQIQVTPVQSQTIQP